MTPTDFNCRCVYAPITRWDRWRPFVRTFRVSAGLSRSKHRPLWPDAKVVTTGGVLGQRSLIVLWLWFGFDATWDRF